MADAQNWLTLSLCPKLYLYHISPQFLPRQDSEGSAVPQPLPNYFVFPSSSPTNSNPEVYNAKAAGEAPPLSTSASAVLVARTSPKAQAIISLCQWHVPSTSSRVPRSPGPHPEAPMGRSLNCDAVPEPLARRVRAPGLSQTNREISRLRGKEAAGIRRAADRRKAPVCCKPREERKVLRSHFRKTRPTRNQPTGLQSGLVPFYPPRHPQLGTGQNPGLLERRWG